MEIANNTVTCADAAQVATLVATPPLTIGAATELLTTTKFTTYARDMHFFYDNDLQAKDTLVSLASGSRDFPAISLANPLAVNKWVVKMQDEKFYLRDSVLAACVRRLVTGHVDDPYRLACLLLWKLIPITECLGMFASF